MPPGFYSYMTIIKTGNFLEARKRMKHAVNHLLNDLPTPFMFLITETSTNKSTLRDKLKDTCKFILVIACG